MKGNVWKPQKRNTLERELSQSLALEGALPAMKCRWPRDSVLLVL